ncbi:MAG TPA: peptidoglycan-binding domain-containing protein [Rhizomicrobium sp.]|nr:peptidoglycan-binding domain-containing protein [Rhizomicrobium sp.]
MSGPISGLARTGLGLAVLILVAASCTETPKPASPVVGMAVPLAPAPGPVPRPDPVMDADSMEAARADLKLLGYGAGKQGDADDTAFQRAIQAFEKDQGLAEDGRLTPALAERLKHLRAELPKPATAVATAKQGEIFIYSDGSQRRQPVGLLPAPPPGLVSDVPGNFLRPMRPGMQGSYHLGVRANGGFTPVATVTCRVEKMAPTNAPAGLFNTLPVTCRTDAKPPAQLQWRSFYAVKLGQVIRQQASAAAGGNRDLIAIRPYTENWPSAARTGLDWALAHALDAAASATPVQWSSTAVPPHFEIHAYAALSPHDAGLPGGEAPTCRRFDLAQSDGPSRLYPGIACRNAKGVWSLPQSNIQIATPAKGFQAAPPL